MNHPEELGALTAEEKADYLSLVEENNFLISEQKALIDPSTGQSTIHNITSALAIPMRGLRGIGVGGQRLLEEADVSFGDFIEDPVKSTVKATANLTLGGGAKRALGRSVAATERGFVPQEGEKLGALGAEMLFFGPAIAAMGPGAAYGWFAQSLYGGASAATTTAFIESAERGDVEPVDVAISAATGMTIPIITASLGSMYRAIRGGARLTATTGTNLDAPDVEEVFNDPKLLESFKGTGDAIGRKIVMLQQSMIKLQDRAGKAINRIRAHVGLNETLEEATLRVSAEGFETINVQEVFQDIAILKTGRISVEAIRRASKNTILSNRPATPAELPIAQANLPGIKGGPKTPQGVREQAMEYRPMLIDEINKPGKVTRTSVKIPDDVRLRDLLRSRRRIDDMVMHPQVNPDVPRISGNDQRILKLKREEINDIIETIPGGKMQRAADKAYAKTRELYDEFQHSLSTQGTAEAAIRRVHKGGKVSDIIGKEGEYVRLIQRVERMEGKDILSPIKREMAARNINRLESTGFTGLPAETMGPKGLASFLTGARRVAEVPGALNRVGTSKGFKGLINAASGVGASKLDE